MPGSIISPGIIVPWHLYLTQWAGILCCSLMICLAAGQYNDCAEGWFQHDLRCYQVHLGKLNWSSAQAKCAENKAVLVGIHSEHENRLIRSQLLKHNTFWIGLRSTGSSPGDFQWSDNTSMGFSEWSKVKPKQSNDQCAFIQDSGKWNLAPCRTVLNVNGYICMRPLEVLLDTTPETANSKGCDSGGYAYDQTCYTLNKEAKAWEEANRICQQQNGTLADVSNSVTAKFIASLPNVQMGSVYWIGLKANNDSYRWPVGTKTTKLTGTLSDASSIQKNIASYAHPFSESSLFFTTRKTWSNAESHCQSLGGHLPSIHDDLTQIFMTSLNKKLRVILATWLGLNDRTKESHFIWSDGTPFDYSAWSRGEPNSLTLSEDCVELYADEGQWGDVNCNVLRPYLCAVSRGMPIPAVQVNPNANLELECAEKDLVFYRGFCYFMTSHQRSWTSARVACLSKGGDLASVLSEDENNFIIHLQSKKSINDIWIGLNRRNQETFSWSDGSPTVYYAWYPTQPKDVNGAEDCASMKINHGLWFNSRCFKELPYLCKASNGSREPATPPSPPLMDADCPEGFFGVENSNKCYYLGRVDKGPKLAWQRAADVCSQIKHPSSTKGQLASIGSPQEQDIVTSIIVSSKSAVWVGLKDFYMEGIYRWIDGSESKFSNWEHGQPRTLRPFLSSLNNFASVIPSEKATLGNSPLLLQCVEAGLSTSKVGQWKTAECDKKNAYLCQIVKVPPATSRHSAPAVCHESPSRNICYLIIHNEIVPWPEAEHVCRQSGMSLASIQSKDESLFVLKLIRQSNQQDRHFWIGLFGKKGGTLRWTDGARFEYTDWETEDPLDYTLDKCVEMNGLTGRWNRDNCYHQKLGFICKSMTATAVGKPEVEKPEIGEPEAEMKAVGKPEVEKPEVEKPDVGKLEVEKLKVGKPEVEKPEIEKPDVGKPETEMPDLGKPEFEKPDVGKPKVEKPEEEKPEVEKPDVGKPEAGKREAGKPEEEKPEVEKPEVEKPEVKEPDLRSGSYSDGKEAALVLVIFSACLAIVFALILLVYCYVLDHKQEIN